MRIIILGCGRTGAKLAQSLVNKKHEVSVIDQNEDAFRLLGEFSGAVVIGKGIDQDILRKAGIENADAFIAVTNADNTNIMAGQIARDKFKVKKIVVRVDDPIRAGAYRELGLIAICPSDIISGLIEKEVGKKA
ncbi:MAG: TrkA family potassium uptake protein [Candidatus Edwardsbacteria bacterium]